MTSHQSTGRKLNGPRKIQVRHEMESRVHRSARTEPASKLPPLFQPSISARVWGAKGVRTNRMMHSSTMELKFPFVALCVENNKSFIKQPIDTSLGVVSINCVVSQAIICGHDVSS